MNIKFAISILVCAGSLQAQLGQTTDWWAFGGDAQRDGFEKNEQKFVKDDVKNFRLLFERKFDNSKKGAGALLAPVILGNLIGYRGFKELAIVAGSDSTLWSTDADLDRPYWTRHLDTAHAPSGKKNCSVNLTAAPALPAPVVFRMPPPKPPAPAAGPTPAAAAGPTPAAKPGSPERLPAFIARFVLPHPVYVLTGDGILHLINQSDGSDLGKPSTFVPPGVTAQALNLSEDIVYTSTHSGCGEDGAVWSIDTGESKAGVKSFKLGADVAGLGGVALGRDGALFVQTLRGTLDPVNGKFGGAVIALTKDLTLGSYFAASENEGKKYLPGMNVTSPLVITGKDQDLVVTAQEDGRVYVLKGPSIGGEDHHQFVAKSAIIPSMDGVKGHGIWGGLSSWEDTDGSRYVLVPVWGPLNDEIISALPKAKDAVNGSIVVFKLQDVNGATTLVPAWVSPDLESPVPPVIAKGVVFALANGKPGKHGHATLFAFDGVTGDTLYSTGDQVKTPGNLTGLSIANGRIYFVTVDNTLHAFGKYLEH